jgi:hypothetical protein
MINKALDLPFDEPLETYSSSEHFAHDMGIPPGTKGRLIPEGQVVIPRQPRKDDAKGGRGGKRDDRGGRGRQGGRDGGSRDSGRGRSEAPATTRSASDETDKPATPRKRNRNRRRTRGGSTAGPTTE